MGLLEQEIMDLRALGASVIAGEIDIDKAKVMLGVYNQTAKRENMLIQLSITTEKYGKDKSWKRLNNMNLMDDKSAIECNSNQQSMCKCPAQGGLLLSRMDCLDYSGDEDHIGTCQNCEQFSVTRDQIAPR